MSDHQNNQPPIYGLLSPNEPYSVRFIINPDNRQMTSASLVTGQDILMETSFPRKNYFIVVAVYPAKNRAEWEFVKSTLITFEGMIRKKFEADKVSRQEAPQIELHFPGIATEDPLKYGDRMRILHRLFGVYHEQKGGLSYTLYHKTAPSLWAIDCVVWGIINKDDFRID